MNKKKKYSHSSDLKKTTDQKIQESKFLIKGTIESLLINYFNDIDPNSDDAWYISENYEINEDIINIIKQKNSEINLIKEKQSILGNQLNIQYEIIFTFNNTILVPPYINKKLYLYGKLDFQDKNNFYLLLDKYILKYFIDNNLNQFNFISIDDSSEIFTKEENIIDGIFNYYEYSNSNSEFDSLYTACCKIIYN